MDPVIHNLPGLFAQLGEPCDEAAIERFIEGHRPLENCTYLHDAPFWSPTQAKFLREAILDDADWAPIVDQLNVQLHLPDGSTFETRLPPSAGEGPAGPV